MRKMLKMLVLSVVMSISASFSVFGMYRPNISVDRMNQILDALEPGCSLDRCQDLDGALLDFGGRLVNSRGRILYVKLFRIEDDIDLDFIKDAREMVIRYANLCGFQLSDPRYRRFKMSIKHCNLLLIQKGFTIEHDDMESLCIEEDDATCGGGALPSYVRSLRSDSDALPVYSRPMTVETPPTYDEATSQIVELSSDQIDLIRNEIAIINSQLSVILSINEGGFFDIVACLTEAFSRTEEIIGSANCTNADRVKKFIEGKKEMIENVARIRGFHIAFRW